MTNSLLCCNLASLVWESQKKLETFANATGYEWLLHLIVWIFFPHYRLADVILINICIALCSLKNAFAFLILLIIHNNSVNIPYSSEKLDMQS